MTHASKHVVLGFKCVSVRPLVTISSSSFQSLDLLALHDMSQEFLDVKEALHFVSITWNCEEPGFAGKVREMLHAASLRLPGHRFIVLANTALENLYLGKEGVESILANCSIFVDERVWHAVRQPSNVVRYDACYVARLAQLKRHELAAGIDNVALVYGDLDLEREQIVREKLPNASFLNRPRAEDPYRYFSHEQTRSALHESAVALCLSATEGFSRTSIEALLCGVPIVSTKAIGGRDRYYHPAYSSIADATPEAVRNAVDELKSRAVDPMAIRSHVGTLLEFDRHNFVKAANGIANETLSNWEREFSFNEFQNSIHDFRPSAEYETQLKVDSSETGGN